MATATRAQTDFCREFLMARELFHPRDFGVDLDKAEFIDTMVDDFNTYFQGSITVDELLCQPPNRPNRTSSTAIRCCSPCSPNS